MFKVFNAQLHQEYQVGFRARDLKLVDAGQLTTENARLTKLIEEQLAKLANSSKKR